MGAPAPLARGSVPAPAGAGPGWDARPQVSPRPAAHPRAPATQPGDRAGNPLADRWQRGACVVIARRRARRCATTAQGITKPRWTPCYHPGSTGASAGWLVTPSSPVAVGTGVVICPGGGFHFLMVDKEGTEVVGRQIPART